MNRFLLEILKKYTKIAKIVNKEASRLYAELCEPMLKFFILVSRNEPDR